MLLIEKLQKIQCELKAPKNLYNSFGKYKYRNAESILEALKPLEEKYKVAVVLNDTIEAIGDRIYVVASATIYDCESEATITASARAREADVKKGMDDAQVTGATSSYARKYALNGIFLLDDTKDVDTEEYQGAKNKAQAEQPKTTKASGTAQFPNRNQFITLCKQYDLSQKYIVEKLGLSRTSPDEDFKRAIEYAEGLVEANGLNEEPTEI